jgi:CDP-6-deoxy-D-xylo-4-hexulose-3-dehydrase
MNGIIPLVKNTISNNEIDELINWLSTYPRLTQGPVVKDFESMWSNYLGINNSIFVNSGSSALLLAYYAFKIKGIKNNNIIVPALSWATDLAPVIQLGMNPILCDCNLEDLSLDLDHLEQLIIEHNPAVVNVVSVLGLVPDMKKILDLKDKYNFFLLEDVCESFGSRYQNKKLGTFGDISVFSLYYGHHLSTIEGGMICTNDEKLNDILKMIRAHGWDRELSTQKQLELRTQYNIDNFSAAYTFYYPGFNVRATDLQAKIGLSQLAKADNIIESRNKNFNYMISNTNSEWKPKSRNDVFVSNFCFPIISKNKNNLIEKLNENNIENRPLICGSMGKQPFYQSQYGKQSLPNCDIIDKNGLYVPNNPDLTQKELDLIVDIINKEIRCTI